jgi:hypothetical protein
VLEEIALELAGAVIREAGLARREAPSASRDRARIARLLRELESRTVEPQSLGDLAERAGLSPYHFLRRVRRLATPISRPRLIGSSFQNGHVRSGGDDGALCGHAVRHETDLPPPGSLPPSWPAPWTQQEL